MARSNLSSTDATRWRGGLVLLALVTALQIAPLWTLSYFPSQDGPSHEALAAVDRLFDRPEGAFLHAYFARNSAIVPNAFASVLMSRVLGFLPIPVAEKVLLTLYVALLPAAVVYAVGAVNARNTSLALLVLPFTYHLPLQTGFYNFSFSIVAFFFAVGYWWRRAEHMTAWHIAAFSALSLWVYFCHVVSFVLLVAAVFATGAWRLRRADAAARQRVLAWLGPPLAGLAPALVLLAIFMRDQTPGVVRWLPFWATVQDLLTLRALDVTSPSAAAWALALAALFWVAISFGLLRRVTVVPGSSVGAWGCVVGLFSLLCAIAPDDIGGGGYVVSRLLLYPYFAAILWIGAIQWPRRDQMWMGTAAAVIALGLLASYWRTWQRLDDYLDEYVSVGDHMEPGRTMIALSYHRMDAAPDGERLAYREDPFLHASGYISAWRQLVDLNIYGASSRVFSMTYRPDVDPYRQFPDLERASPSADILSYPARTGGRIDYVIVWRATEHDPEARALIAQLNQAYDRTFVSARGLAELYQHR